MGRSVRLASPLALALAGAVFGAGVQMGGSLLLFTGEGFLLTFAFHERIMEWMTGPLPADRNLVTFGVTEPFTTSIKVSLIAALALSLAIARWLQEQRSRELTETADLRRQLAQAQMEVLALRLHPHFLFNSLNAVLALIRRDPQRAERALEDLADLFRTLMSDARHFVRLADEIALLERYAGLFASRTRVMNLTASFLQVSARNSSTACMSRTPPIIASTASCSGKMMQY